MNKQEIGWVSNGVINQLNSEERLELLREVIQYVPKLQLVTILKENYPEEYTIAYEENGILD